MKNNHETEVMIFDKELEQNEYQFMATPIISGVVSLLIDKYKSQHNGVRPDSSVLNEMLKLLLSESKGVDSKTGSSFSPIDRIPYELWGIKEK